MTKNRWMAALAAVLLLAGVGTVAATRSLAGSDEKAATEAFKKLSNKGNDTTIVATVNGEPVTRRAVELTLAFSLINGAADASGKPLAGVTPEQALRLLIDNSLLAQAAETHGVVATDDEVTLMINSGLIDPIAKGDYPADAAEAMKEHLKAAGTSLKDAQTNPELRAAYRKFLLLQRYVSQSGQTRDALLAQARAAATIQTFPERLANTK